MFLLSFLHDERAMIRSRKKALSGVSSRCGQTPENPSAIQCRYQVSMVIWKTHFFSFSWFFFIHLEGKQNKLPFFNAILTKMVSGITWVGDEGPCCAAAVPCYLVLWKSTPLLPRMHLNSVKDKLFFSHASRQKGAFLLRRSLDKALLPFSATCHVFATRLIAQQDECPSSTRGKGWPITHSL